MMASSATARDGRAADGYLGANVVENAAGQTVFSWFFPGPVDGAGLRSNRFDLHRPDVLASVDGRAMSAGEFNEYIRTRAPGTTVTIGYKRAKQRGTSNVPASVDTDDEIRTIEVVIERRDDYTGTIGRPRALGREWTPPDDPPFLDPFDPGNILGEAVAENDLIEPIEKLAGVFEQWLNRTQDHHMLSRVRAPFLHPFRIVELEREITGEARQVPVDPFMSAVNMIANNLDIVRIPRGDDGRGGSGNAEVLPAGLIAALSDMHHHAERGLGALWMDEAFARQAVEFLRVPRRTFYIAGPNAKDHIGVIRASMDVGFSHLIHAMECAEPFVTSEWKFTPETPTIEPPEELRDAVSGRIIAAQKYHDIGWVVIGSYESNRYDMSKIACVIDPGGDDEYYVSDLALGVRVIVDLAGNDVYRGSEHQGAGGALLGVWLIDDRAGDDRYEGPMLSAGAACFGMSILIDRAGNDVYKGGEWSQGAACYGAGILIDLAGSDVYEAEFLSQGVGGPRGFGAIINGGGNDLFRANGPHGSAYGTPAVYRSFSQGVGFGYRNYAAGGIGLISNLGGNDRYEAGEFSQGGAYYFGLGILHDAAGNDLYYGNRYGQGFGVHQAHGVLADDAGDDVYWSMTAASQGAAWDIGVGLLIDRGGNDTYRCDGLGQGAASMQGIGMLIDLGGTDQYIAGGGATQGQSGGDSYHYHTTGAFSFSLLMDLGGTIDFYSRQRANNSVTKTGSINEDNPENSSAWGLVIDR